MRANAWIVAATFATLVGLCGACCKKPVVESQQGTLAVQDGTTVVTGKADDLGGACPNSTTTRTLSIVNTSLGDVSVSAVTVSTGPFTATTPALPFTVPASGTTPLPITFAPTTTGPAAATLTITSDAENSPVTVNLTATGISGGPQPVYSATCSYLGPDGGQVTQQYPCSTLLWQAAIGSSVSDTLQLSDQGCPALVIQSAVIAMEGGSDGGVSPFTLQGVTLPESVSPSTPMALTIQYSPTVAGTFDLATLTLTTNDPVNSLGGAGTPGVFVYNLEGTGLAPACQISPAQEDFGAVQEGQTVSQVFTVSNNGTLPVTLQAPTLASAGPYSLSNAWSSGQVLSPVGGGSNSAQCTVSFTSPGNGLFQDRLTVGCSSSEGSESVSASLIAHSSGELCPSPNPLQLPATGFCGTITAPLTLGNCGNADLHVSAVDFASGSGNPDDTFSVTLPAGTTLPADITADGGLTVTVTYVDNGRLTDPVGTLLVVSDDPQAPDGGTMVSVIAQVSAVPPPGDSPAQLPDSGVGKNVTTVFVAAPGNDAPLYSYVWSVVPAGCDGITLVPNGGSVAATPTSTGTKCNICLQAYEQPADGGFNCGFDSGVPGNCTPFNP